MSITSVSHLSETETTPHCYPASFNRGQAVCELLDLRSRFIYFLDVDELEGMQRVFDRALGVAFDAIEELIRLEEEAHAPLPERGSIHQYSDD